MTSINHSQSKNIMVCCRIIPIYHSCGIDTVMPNSSHGCIRTACMAKSALSFLCRHNGCDGASNHKAHHCLLNRLFRHRSKKTSKLRVTGLCAGNSPVTSEFPAQMSSNAENVSIWWCHHVTVQWCASLITLGCWSVTWEPSKSSHVTALLTRRTA